LPARGIFLIRKNIKEVGSVTTETTGKKDASYTLAKNIVATQFKDIPAEVVEVTKKDILDTLGVTIAGSSFESTEPLLELAREWGGKGESTILVFGDKVPSVNAVLINGTMSEAYDFTDGYGRGLIHVGQTTVIPALAIAEQKGRIDGKDLISAIVLGQDLALRIFLSMELLPLLAWVGVDNCFGATATVGKLLGLNEEQMANAFGIAYNQVSGSLQSYLECVNTKELIAGLTGRTGVLSASLAQKGFTGIRNTFEGEAGFCNTYCQERCNLEQLTADLGKNFEGINMGFKPYPCGY
jgi:2-methylcitrate dehydratase PrpD